MGGRGRAVLPVLLRRAATLLTESASRHSPWMVGRGKDRQRVIPFRCLLQSYFVRNLKGTGTVSDLQYIDAIARDGGAELVLILGNTASAIGEILRDGRPDPRSIEYTGHAATAIPI